VRHVWLRWTLATAGAFALLELVFAVGTLFLPPLAGILSVRVSPDWAAAALGAARAGAIAGALVGLAQWLVVRRLLAGVWEWIPLTIVGTIAAFFVVAWAPLRAALDGAAGDVLLEALATALVALAQWILLRQRVAGAWRWVAAGVVLGAALGAARAAGPQPVDLPGAATRGAAAVLWPRLYGLATDAIRAAVMGLVLTRLLPSTARND
jgi:hypothetical protein